MMLRKLEYENSNSPGDSNNGQLLRDIEEISKALYLNKAPSNNSRSKSAGRIRLSESKSSLNPISFKEDSSFKDKKSSSVWNWKKPLKALTHIGNKKYHCCFYLHVHSIEGLPTNFDNLSICVRWKRKDEVFHTSSSKVSRGTAEFEETLMNQCSVYGSSGGPDHRVKYESKLFLLYASVIEAPGLDIGKQWVDLTSFLPRTLEELEGDKSRGQWSTSFNLSGKAKGASLNVSFGFWVMRDKLPNSGSNSKFPELLNIMQNSSAVNYGFGTGHSNHGRMLWRVDSVRGSGSNHGTVNHGSDLLRPSLDVKVCREVLLKTGLELSNSLNCLYQKFDEGNLCVSEEPDSEKLKDHKDKLDLDFGSVQEIEGHDWDITAFSITEVGTEISENWHLELDQGTNDKIDGLAVETINVDDKDYKTQFEKKTMSVPKDDNCTHGRDKVVVDDRKDDSHNDYSKGLATEELDSACNPMLISGSTDLDPLVYSREYTEQENRMDAKASYKRSRSVKRSLSLDNVAESVATDFFNMLGMSQGSYLASSDCDPESPRELLLRQFEEEALASGNFIFDFDAQHDESEIGCSNAPWFRCMDYSEESELPLIIHDAEEEHKRVSELLKRRKAKILEDLETKALMRQWGLNEKDIQGSPPTCSDGFGSPIELPPQELPPSHPLGEGFGPYVQMKNGGFLCSMNPSHFKNAKNGGYLIIQVSNPVILPAEMGYDVLEILQNMALVGAEDLYEQIRELSPLEDIVGKTIKQVAFDAPPSTTAPQRNVLPQHDSYGAMAEFDGLQSGWHYNLRSSSVADETLLEFASLEDLSPSVVNKFEALLLEGLKIQSRMSGEEPPSRLYPQFTREIQASEYTSHTNTSDLLSLSLTLEDWLSLDSGNIDNEGHDRELVSKTLAAHHAISEKLKQDVHYRDQESVMKFGILGNNLTIAHLVQLRDPLRNYDPVGVPMLLLIEVRRRLFGVISENKEKTVKDKDNEDNSRFRVTGVHLAGASTFPHDRQLWGTAAQQQSGTRWLLASGITRSVCGYASKSKAIVRSSPLRIVKPQPEDILWSISSNDSELTASWKDLATLHTRNPDVIFQSETNYHQTKSK